MLGLMTWFIGAAVPAMGVGIFVATRKRLSLQWREELMDPSCSAFPPLHPAELESFCTVASDALVSEPLQKPVGLRVSRGLSKEEGATLLENVRQWVRKYGNPFDPRIVEFWEQQCNGAGRDPHLPGQNMLVSDHAEDVQASKAPWGTGDKIDYAEMPATMRYLVKRVQDEFEGVSGRLRHVYIEYSPSGEFFHKPNVTKAFDGHEYVVIPLRARNSDTVVTFSPTVRSRSTEMKEVMLNSWCSKDIDALVPSGKFLRVYGVARYDYSWSVRPGQPWFGCPQRCIGSSAAPAGPSPAVESLWTRFWKPKQKESAPLTQSKSAPQDDAALVVLHFEGPRRQGKKRSLLLHPESLIFGLKPEPATYERWVNDRPTERDVWDDWVIFFVAKNYLNMLKSS
jgi:hypothetical protein